MKEVELPGGARLFVPEGHSRSATGAASLTVHLHGGHAAVQQAFRRSGRRGALVTLILPGLSTVYTRHFATDPAGVFFGLLETAAKEMGVASLDTVWVSSFSAGFGGVRELLKSPPVYRRIETLVLADTLYAGFAGGAAASVGETGQRPPPDPANLHGFVTFARDAAAGRKGMLVTYSALVPPTYSSTAETAAALMAATGTTSTVVSEAWPNAMTLTARARKGRFAVYGFAGDDGPAHMKHLSGLEMFYRLVPRV